MFKYMCDMNAQWSCAMSNMMLDIKGNIWNNMPAMINERRTQGFSTKLLLSFLFSQVEDSGYPPQRICGPHPNTTQ